MPRLCLRDGSPNVLAPPFFLLRVANTCLLLALSLVLLGTSGSRAQDWAFEESFDGDPGAPSQALLPRTFEYLATHRTHPKEQFSKPYAAFPADHATDCTGPNPAISPLPQHDVFTTQSSNSVNPDASFFLCKNHMMSSMGEVESYSNTLFWPRQEFDFSDGGVLEFDVNINEGHTIRSWWEVLIAPREQMRFAPAPLQSAVDETYPRDRIVLDFRGDVRQIRVGTGAIAPQGWIVQDRHFGKYDYLDWRDLYPDDPALDDRRIRRKMRIRLEGEEIIWGIQTADGSFDEFAVAVPGGLPFTRGVVQFKTHAYTPYKLGNQSVYTFHWDNIRFSGPRLMPYAAYHADDVVYLQRNGDRAIGDQETVRINLPDDMGDNPVLAGQINAPINGQPLLSINGGPDRAVGPDDYPIENCSSGEWRDWASFRIPLDAAELRPGENTFRWTVGPRPACAAGKYWWDGYSVKFLHVQTDGGAVAEPPIEEDNLAPEVEITSPPGNLAIRVGETLSLIASAFDAEDGDVSGDITWSSNIDGPLGEAAMVTPTLSEGAHLIVARAVDSAGVSGSASVMVNVEALPSDAPLEFIVDDKDSANVVRRGTWRTSSMPNPWLADRYTVHPVLQGSAGILRCRTAVAMRSICGGPLQGGRSSQAPVTVSSLDGKDTQLKNQKRGGGQWQLLGTYPFETGTTHHVELSARNGTASADAIRVVRVDP